MVNIIHILWCITVMLWGLFLNPQQHTILTASLPHCPTPPAASPAGGYLCCSSCSPYAPLNLSYSVAWAGGSPQMAPPATRATSLNTALTPPGVLTAGGVQSTNPNHPFSIHQAHPKRGVSSLKPPTPRTMPVRGLTPPALSSAGGVKTLKPFLNLKPPPLTS